MRVTLCVLAAACGALEGSGLDFALQVRGTVNVMARGSAEVGPTGPPGEPYYTITLGGPDGDAAVVFTRAGSDYPPVGEYPVGERELTEGGFSGLVITGRPAHPTGVFRVQSGRLTITAGAADELAGRFELRAVGFLTEAPDADDRSVTVDGSFTVGAPGGEAHSSRTPGASQ